MTSWSILGHTAKVLEERRDDYGDPADQFKSIAARWSITLGMPVSPAQVALCMIDLKLTRLTGRLIMLVPSLPGRLSPAHMSAMPVAATLMT